MILGSLFMWALFGAFGMFDGGSDEEPEPDDDVLLGSDGDDMMSANGPVTLKAGSGADVISASGDATVYGG